MPPLIGPQTRRRPRRRPNPQVFGPVASTTSAIRGDTAVKRSRERVRRAEEKVPGATVPLARIPHGPLTPTTRKTLVQHHERTIKREIAKAGGVRSYTRLLEGEGDHRAAAARAKEIAASEGLGDHQTRRALHQLRGAQRRARKLDDIAMGRVIAQGMSRDAGLLNPLQQDLIHGTAKPSGRGLHRRDLLEDLGRAARQPTGPDAGKFRGTTYRTQRSGNIADSLHLSGLPVIGGAAKTTGDVLEFTARPLHATAGAVRALERGEGVGEALSEAGRGLTGKQKITFGDILREHGSSGAVATIGGFGADVAFDPLNYLSFGLTAPASAARGAAGTATRGLRVALRAPGGRATADVPLVTRATAAAAKSTTAPVGRMVRESAVGQAVGKGFVPGFRPRGVDPVEWQKAIDLERTTRAQARTGVKLAERRGRAYQRALTGDADASRAVVAASERAPKDVAHANQIRQEIETLTTQAERQPENLALQEALAQAESNLASLPSHSIHALPEPLKSIALTARKELRQVGEQERSLGLLGALRQGYIPHQWDEVLQREAGRTRRGVETSTRNRFADPRKLRGSIEEVNARAVADGLEPIFSTNLPALMTQRLAKSARSQSGARFRKGLVNENIAKPLTKSTLDRGIREHDMLYSLSREGIKPLANSHGLADFGAARKAIDDGEMVVSMNRMIGDRYTAGRTHFDPVNPLEGPTIGRGFDRFVSGMKTAFTVFNVPAYDLRNLYGDLFNAYLADTHAKDVLDAFRAMRTQASRHGEQSHLAGRELKDFTLDLGRKGGGERSVASLLREAEHHGAIDTGYIGGEKFEVVRGTQGATGVRMPGGVHPVDRMRSVSQVREDGVRFATYLGARRRGMTPTEAARWTNAHHFDYADLTDLERGVMRRIFPFYTWMARNTPLQTKRLLTNPGKYANYEAAREESAKHSGLGPEWEDKLQPYQRRAGGIPFSVGDMGGAYMAYPALPLMDLARPAALASGDWKGLFDLTAMNVNPIIKSPLEFGLNYSTFFRSPIYRTEDASDARHWVPAPPQLASVPALRDVLGMKRIPDPRNGGKPTWMWTAKADYWARQTPQSNFALQALTPATGSHSQTSKMAVVSQLSGVKIGTYDRTTNELREAQAKLRELDVRARDMRDEGTDRSGPSKGHYSKAYRQVLNKQRRLRKRVERLKKKQGYAGPKPRVSRGGRPSGSYGGGSGGGTYGTEGGGTVYGTQPSGSLYGG